MARPVYLKRHIFETLKQEEFIRVFYEVDTGDYHVVPEMAFAAIDNELPREELYLHGVSEGEYDMAVAIDNGDRHYRALPDLIDFDSFHILSLFTESVEDQALRKKLDIAFWLNDHLHTFLSILEEYDYLEAWFAFRESYYRQMMIDWCRSNRIGYIKE